MSAPAMTRAISTEELNTAALHELVANRPAHTDAPNCPCRACFLRGDRSGYWTRGGAADGEVTP